MEGACTNSTITVDGSGVAYVPCNTGSVYEFTTSNFHAVTGSPFASSKLSGPYGSAVDGLGRIWMTNNSATSIAYLSAGVFTGITNSCLQGPRFIAIDGNDNVWVTNGNPITVGTGTSYTVCEFNSSGALISNSVGYELHNINTGRGIAVDPSGNVWVSNYATTATTVTEIVGAAVPAVTPIVSAIKNGKVGARP
jgi:streptogramin lyase